MRDLTATEIEQFDFTGLVPELNRPVYKNKVTASAKAKRLVKLPRGKRRLELGLALTA